MMVMAICMSGKTKALYDGFPLVICTPLNLVDVAGFNLAASVFEARP